MCVCVCVCVCVTYIGSSISSIESDESIHLVKVWTALDHVEV